MADFTTFTRQRTLDAPIYDASLVLDVAPALLDAEMRPGRRFRLIGVGLVTSRLKMNGRALRSWRPFSAHSSRLIAPTLSGMIGRQYQLGPPFGSGLT
jgi:hypothetical protein